MHYENHGLKNTKMFPSWSFTGKSRARWSVKKKVFHWSYR